MARRAFGVLSHGRKGVAMDALQESYGRALLLEPAERAEVVTLFRLAADFLEHQTPPPVEAV